MRPATTFIPRSVIVAVIAITSISANTMAPTPAHAAGQFTVNIDEPTSDFPNGIDFQLDVQGKRTIRRIELLYQAADFETLNLSVPDFKPGKHVALTHHLNLLTHFMPAGIDISYRWRITDDRDNALETDFKTVLWLDSRFDWQKFSSTDVTVYAYVQNDAFNGIILDTAQRTVDRLKVLYGLEKMTPIRIWIYNSKQDFSAWLQGNSLEWSVATTYPEFKVIGAALPEGGTREVGRVIPHEVSHAVLYQATKNPFNGTPTWLDEGLAVLSQENGNEDFPALVKDAAEKGRLFSIRGLNGAYPYDPADSTLAYAEYYMIVRFIIDQFGEDKLKTVIAAYREGVSHDQALQAGIGLTIDELDRLWKESLNYPGDQPQGAGATRKPSSWTDFFGSGLATGSLIVVIALLIVGLYGLTSNRRVHRSPSRAG